MGETPRTDAAMERFVAEGAFALFPVMRQLEHELAIANAAIRHLEAARDTMRKGWETCMNECERLRAELESVQANKALHAIQPGEITSDEIDALAARAEEGAQALQFEEHCFDGQKCGATTTGCRIGQCQRKQWNDVETARDNATYWRTKWHVTGDPRAWEYWIAPYGHHHRAHGVVLRKEEMSDAVPKDRITWHPLYGERGVSGPLVSQSPDRPAAPVALLHAIQPGEITSESPAAVAAPVPRWVTSWPDWYGVFGNVEVVPASDYDVVVKAGALRAVPPQGEITSEHVADMIDGGAATLLRPAVIAIASANPGPFTPNKPMSLGAYERALEAARANAFGRNKPPAVAAHEIPMGPVGATYGWSYALSPEQMDRANTELAVESAKLRGFLSELVEAVDGMEDLDEQDGEEFQRNSERLDAAVEAARPYIELTVAGEQLEAPGEITSEEIDAIAESHARQAADAEEAVRREEGAQEWISVAEIEAEIEHIKENGARVREFPGMEDEGRCRELCAMYLLGFINSKRIGDELALLGKFEQ